MLHIAATQPATFLGIAARLIPQQVQMDLHAVLPGNLSPTTGPIFGSFFRPSSRPFQMLLIVHPEPYFSMSWPSCKTDHFLVRKVTSVMTSFGSARRAASSQTMCRTYGDRAGPKKSCRDAGACPKVGETPAAQS